MTTPPAHRRLVPRGSKGPGDPLDPDDFEDTARRPKLDRSAVEDDARPSQLDRDAIEDDARRSDLDHDAIEDDARRSPFARRAVDDDDAVEDDARGSHFERHAVEDEARASRFDREAVEDDAGPDPGGSYAMTSRRPLLEPEDALEVELTLETRGLDQSADDSFHQMTVERVRPISQPGDSLDEQLAAQDLDPPDDEPPPLDRAPSAPRFSNRVLPGAGEPEFLNEPTGLDRASGSGAEDRPMSHVSPAERGFLLAMAEGHEPSRLIYADWLARRGELARAEYLRLDHALVTMSPLDDRFTRTLLRLRELAPHISVDWRSRVARSSIEGCLSRNVRCPGEWRALPSDRDDVRDCPACTEPVYYCATIQLAQERILLGQRVAIDITCNRWPGDLGEQCSSCRGHIPSDTRFCPHCGRPIHGG